MVTMYDKSRNALISFLSIIIVLGVFLFYLDLTNSPVKEMIRLTTNIIKLWVVDYPLIYVNKIIRTPQYLNVLQIGGLIALIMSLFNLLMRLIKRIEKKPL